MCHFPDVFILLAAFCSLVLNETVDTKAYSIKILMESGEKPSRIIVTTIKG